jgi:hypothetical protein
METTASFVAIFAATLISVLVAIFLPFVVMSGKQYKESQAKARERHLTDARMNARLLRLNL